MYACTYQISVCICVGACESPFMHVRVCVMWYIAIPQYSMKIHLKYLYIILYEYHKDHAMPIHFSQFAEAYKDLQNISRRHIHVHEPLIYDSVWLATMAIRWSEILTLPHFNETHNTTLRSEQVEREMQQALERYSHFITGLTVSSTFTMVTNTRTCTRKYTIYTCTCTHFS